MNEQGSTGSQSRFDQQGQTVHGPQTNVAGDVQGPVLSGQFQGPVTITEVNVEQAQPERLHDAIIAPAAVCDRVHIEHFVGREWLAAQVNDFLRQEKCGYFVLEAEAGLGKTSFMAWLAQRRGYICLFCEDAPGLENVGKGLKSLAAQLVLAHQLAPWADAGILPPTADRPDVFYKLLSQAAAAARGRQPNRVVLVIDALDQAGAPVRQNALSLPRTLPEGVFIIVSQRPTSVALDVDAPCLMVQLSAEQADNQRDMRQFLERAADWPGIVRARQRDGYSSRQLIDILMDKCCGIWIYLHYVIQEIERDEHTLAQLHNLPDGIVKYYIEYWRQERQDDEAQWYGLSLPLLAALTAAPEPATARQLCAWAGLTGQISQVQHRLDEHWCSFINTTGGDRQPRYRFYHATLRDFFAGQVDRRGLPKAARGFIDELRRATIAALYRALRAASTPGEKRRHALQLVRWQGLNEIEDPSTEEFLEILELVAGFAYAEAERRYLIESIDSVLTSPDAGLSKRRRAHLLVYRAGLYGNLGDMDEAAGSYQQAEQLAGELVKAADTEAEDLKLNARIKHGEGVILTARAESLEEPGEDEGQEGLLGQATKLLQEAADWAVQYGKDPMLTAIVRKELCWTYALLQEWQHAEETYQAAMRVLEEVEDREARDGSQAKVLETAGYIYLEKGYSLKDNVPAAMQAFQDACRVAEQEIKILTKTPGSSEPLAIAYLNYGHFLLASRAQGGEESPFQLAEACRYWRLALEMARILGIRDVAQQASEFLEEHCP